MTNRVDLSFFFRQLMSYSGEWIYSLRSNLRKDSITASEVIRKSLTPSVSIGSMIVSRATDPTIDLCWFLSLDLNAISSSDTETEDNTSASDLKRHTSPRHKSNQANSNSRVQRMIAPTLADEQKLNSVKQTVQRRPQRALLAQSFSRPKPERGSSSNILTGGSSDDVDSLYDQSTNYTGRTSRSTSSSIVANNSQTPGPASTTRKSNDSLITVQNINALEADDKVRRDRYAVDCASVTSSEWGADDNKSEREGSTFQRHNASVKSKRRPRPHFHEYKRESCLDQKQ